MVQEVRRGTWCAVILAPCTRLGAVVPIFVTYCCAKQRLTKSRGVCIAGIAEADVGSTLVERLTSDYRASSGEYYMNVKHSNA